MRKYKLGDFMMKRLFVAVELSDDFKDYLFEQQKEVIHQAEKGKFHKKDNLHLTIEFIGIVAEELINPIWQAIVEGLSAFDSFDFNAKGLGYFEKKNKKIPWVGVEAPALLNEIQKESAKAVGKVIDHIIDHDYIPHITLGRQVVIEALPDLLIDYRYHVKEICLMESSSASGSLSYTPIRRHQLK